MISRPSSYQTSRRHCARAILSLRHRPSSLSTFITECWHRNRKYGRIKCPVHYVQYCQCVCLPLERIRFINVSCVQPVIQALRGHHRHKKKKKKSTHSHSRLLKAHTFVNTPPVCTCAVTLKIETKKLNDNHFFELVILRICKLRSYIR